MKIRCFKNIWWISREKTFPLGMPSNPLFEEVEFETEKPSICYYSLYAQTSTSKVTFMQILTRHCMLYTYAESRTSGQHQLPWEQMLGPKHHFEEDCREVKVVLLVRISCLRSLLHDGNLVAQQVGMLQLPQIITLTVAKL